MALAATFSCGSSSREIAPLTAAEQSERHFHSVGDSLLRHAPAGAQLVIEIDLKRLRDNAVVGDLVARAARISAQGDAEFEPLRDADAFVMCAYELGTVSARTLTVVRSDRLAELAGDDRLADGIVAVGPRDLRERASNVEASASMASDPSFLELRDLAVPDKAPGAALRVTVSLDFDARVSMARLLDLDRVPTSVSVWGDVVDDLAVIAVLGAEGKRDAKLMARTSRAWLRRAAELPLIRRLVLGYLLDEVRVQPTTAATRWVLVVNPHRLRLLARRLERYLSDGDREEMRPTR